VGHRLELNRVGVAGMRRVHQRPVLVDARVGRRSGDAEQVGEGRRQDEEPAAGGSADEPAGLRFSRWTGELSITEAS
jgi:hypothetical protein